MTGQRLRFNLYSIPAAEIQAALTSECGFECATGAQAERHASQHALQAGFVLIAAGFQTNLIGVRNIENKGLKPRWNTKAGAQRIIIHQLAEILYFALDG